MKINFTTYSLAPSGGARVLIELANRLARKGHEVSITLPTLESTKPMLPVEVPVITPPGRYIEGSGTLDLMLRAMYSISRKLGYKRAYEPDLIRKLSDITPECDFNIAMASPTAFAVHRSRKGVPIYFVQGHEADLDLNPYMRRIAEESYLLPMNTIVVSTYLQTLLYRRYSRQSFLCLNGIDHEIFHPRKRPSKSRVKTVMCIGRSESWKGLGEVVKAMNLVSKHLSNVRLIICALHPVRIENAHFPYTILTNLTQEELAQQYCESDLFVSASRVESFGMGPLEAMASGCPVVSTNIGNGDYAQNQVNSLLVSPENPEQLADAIVKVLTNENLGDSLVKEGLRTAARFNWDSTTSRFEAFILQAISNGVSP